MLSRKTATKNPTGFFHSNGILHQSEFYSSEKSFHLIRLGLLDKLFRNEMKLTTIEKATEMPHCPSRPNNNWQNQLRIWVESWLAMMLFQAQHSKSYKLFRLVDWLLHELLLMLLDPILKRICKFILLKFSPKSISNAKTVHYLCWWVFAYIRCNWIMESAATPWARSTGKFQSMPSLYKNTAYIPWWYWPNKSGTMHLSQLQWQRTENSTTIGHWMKIVEWVALVWCPPLLKIAELLWKFPFFSLSLSAVWKFC